LLKYEGRARAAVSSERCYEEDTGLVNGGS